MAKMSNVFAGGIDADYQLDQIRNQSVIQNFRIVQVWVVNTTGVSD